MTTKTEQYSNYTFARIGKRAVQIHPTHINSRGKFLSDPDFDEIDLYRVCPKCGIQGMAYTEEFQPPLKGKKRRRRVFRCLFCGTRSVLGKREWFPILNIDELPDFDPMDDKIYARGFDKMCQHDFDEEFGPTPKPDDFGD